MVLPSASGIPIHLALCNNVALTLLRNLELPAQVSETHLLRFFFHLVILIPPGYFFISAHSFSRSIVELCRLPRVYVATTVLHLSPGRILEARHGTAAAEGRGRRRRRRMADNRPCGGKQRAFRCRHGYTLATRMLGEEPRKGKKAGGCCGARLFSSAAFRAPMETGR